MYQENYLQERLSSIVNQNEQTEHLLSKLRQVFKDGYRPSRGTQPYNVRLDNQVKAYTMVNCMGHVFNLCNEQFNDYHFNPYKMYGYFPGFKLNQHHQNVNLLFDFMKETGLKVEECDPSEPIKDFKSWKVALYFESDERYKDFHFLLEDRPNFWSSKIGFKPCVEHIYETKPPETYRNLVDKYPPLYKLHNTYKITNPNADENNRYLKRLVLPRNSAPKSLTPHQYVAENEHEDNFYNIFDELLARQK